MEEIQKTNGMEQDIVKLLQQTFGDNLLSVMLYGSYIEGNYIPKLSDINTLIILKEAVPGELLNLGKASYRFLKKT